MRGIKFRAWVINDFDGDGLKEYMDDDPATLSSPLKAHKDGDIVLMQFTGLEDKNGVDIYEGDILECEISQYTKHNAVVRFGEYEQDGSGSEYPPTTCIGFYADAIEPDKLDEDGYRKILKFDRTASLKYFSNLKIIGNIYENPELISQ